MKAVADRFPIEQIVVEGLAAGLDHFIIRGPVERQLAAWEALVRPWRPARRCGAGCEKADPDRRRSRRRLQVGPPRPRDQLAVGVPLAGAPGVGRFFRDRPEPEWPAVRAPPRP